MAWGMTVAPTMPVARSTLSRPRKRGTNPAATPCTDARPWRVSYRKAMVTTASKPATVKSKRRRPGEWHFGWALEGRAIQDVWIVPPRGQRQGDAVALSNRYGTTLRVYDPAIDAWHIQWTDPVGQTYLTMIGRAQGNDIVQLGKSAAGHLIRWGFYEIKPASFLWRGEASVDNEAVWKRVVEFIARRR